MTCTDDRLEELRLPTPIEMWDAAAQARQQAMEAYDERWAGKLADYLDRICSPNRGMTLKGSL